MLVTPQAEVSVAGDEEILAALEGTVNVRSRAAGGRRSRTLRPCRPRRTPAAPVAGKLGRMANKLLARKVATLAHGSQLKAAGASIGAHADDPNRVLCPPIHDPRHESQE